MKSLRLLAVVGLTSAALAGMVASAAGTYGTHDCGPMVQPQFTQGGAWITTDPATLRVGGNTYVLSSRALVVGYAQFSLEGVPTDNTHGCYFEGAMPAQEQERILKEFGGSVHFVEISATGQVKIEDYPLPDGTWTPQPTSTPVPTSTTTPDPKPYKLYLASLWQGVISNSPTPAPRPTEITNYEEYSCGQYNEVNIVDPQTGGAWTTADEQTVTIPKSGETLYIGNRTTIVSQSSYILSKPSVSTTCYFKGWPSETRIEEVQPNASAVIIIDSDGIPLARP